MAEIFQHRGMGINPKTLSHIVFIKDMRNIVDGGPGDLA